MNRPSRYRGQTTTNRMWLSGHVNRIKNRTNTYQQSVLDTCYNKLKALVADNKEHEAFYQIASLYESLPRCNQRVKDYYPRFEALLSKDYRIAEFIENKKRVKLSSIVYGLGYKACQLVKKAIALDMEDSDTFEIRLGRVFEGEQTVDFYTEKYEVTFHDVPAKRLFVILGLDCGKFKLGDLVNHKTGEHVETPEKNDSLIFTVKAWPQFFKPEGETK